MTTIYIPIVGLRHYADDVEALIRKLERRLEGEENENDNEDDNENEDEDRVCSTGTSVWLVKDDDNLYDPNMAVAAYVDRRKVGYVGAIYLPIVRTEMGDDDKLEASFALAEDGRKAFFAKLTIHSDYYPDYEPQLETTPITGIPVPKLRTEHDLLLRQIHDTIDMLLSLEPAAQLAALCRHLEPLVEAFVPRLGTSLNGDDIRTYTALISFVQSLIFGLPDEILDRQEEDTMTGYYIRTILYERYKDAAMPDRATADRLFRNEYESAKQVLCAENGLTEQVISALEMMPMPEEAIREELEMRKEWLRRMPYHLAASLGKEDFAQRLQYRRFSLREMDMLFANLAVMEALENRLTKQKKSGSSGSGGKKNTRTLESFWQPNGSPVKREKARHELALLADHDRYGLVPLVVEWAMHWEQEGVLKPFFGREWKFFCDYALEKGVRIDPSGLQRNYKRKREQS